jgi:hypothetical protein
LLVLVLVAAVTAAAAPSEVAATDSATCGKKAYSYAGIAGWNVAGGVAATVELQATPQVEHGHIAAWVGVGGVGMGPGHTNEWIQAGLATIPGTGNVLYYEITQPNQAPKYVQLRSAVAIGERHRVAVIEMERRPNWWRVWVDHRLVTRPIHLPGSHARWQPVATSESWNGGVASCNGYAYRFRTIRVRHSSWSLVSNVYRIETPGYKVAAWRRANLLVVGGGASSSASTPAPPDVTS